MVVARVGNSWRRCACYQAMHLTQNRKNAVKDHMQILELASSPCPWMYGWFESESEISHYRRLWRQILNAPPRQDPEQL